MEISYVMWWIVIYPVDRFIHSPFEQLGPQPSKLKFLLGLNQVASFKILGAMVTEMVAT